VALASHAWLPAVATASVAMLITAPHHFATFLRTYGFEDERQRWKGRLMAAPIAIFAVTLAGIYYAPLTFLLLATIWDHQHSVMQQYGFSRIYDFKASSGAPSTKKFDLALGWVLYANLFLTTPLFTEYWVLELYSWKIEITAATVATIQLCSWSVTALFGLAYIGHLGWSVKRGYRLNPIKYLFLAASYFLWYFVGWQTGSLIIYLIAHRLMHGLQYIVMVYWYIRRKSAGTGRKGGFLAALTRAGNVKAFLLISLFYAVIYNLLLGNGFEVFGFGIVNPDLRYDSLRELGGLGSRQGFEVYTVALAQSVAVVHYYFDSFIWKVRDSSVQEGL